MRHFGITLRQTAQALTGKRRVEPPAGTGGNAPPAPCTAPPAPGIAPLPGIDTTTAMFRIVLSLMVVIFSFYLITRADANNEKIGSGLLGTVLGYWLR